MPRQLLRIKLSGAEIIELYLDTICGFSVDYIEKENQYILSALLHSGLYTIKEGTFDACHFLLNKIHSSIGTSQDSIINV